MKILIIGGGNMGQSFAKSFLNNYITDISNFAVLEKDITKHAALKAIGIKNIFDKPDRRIAEADLIVLAVKPQAFPALKDELKAFLSDEQVILSIMAGVSIKTIQEALDINKVIRAMPNIAAQIGEGMSVFTSSEAVTRIELVTVQNLLESTGKNLYVPEEDLIDAGTAVSGSGPAYVLYFMEAMMQAAIELGFTKPQAEMLTSQTFRGIVEYFQNAKDDYRQLIDKISSKGGTTEAAIRYLDQYKTNEIIRQAITKAYQRARELGKIS